MTDRISMVFSAPTCALPFRYPINASANGSNRQRLPASVSTNGDMDIRITRERTLKRRAVKKMHTAANTAEIIMTATQKALMFSLPESMNPKNGMKANAAGAVRYLYRKVSAMPLDVMSAVAETAITMIQ